MPKGYLVANIRVQDKEKFAAFSGMAAPIIEAHGGKVLARGTNAERHEGHTAQVVLGELSDDPCCRRLIVNHYMRQARASSRLDSRYELIIHMKELDQRPIDALARDLRRSMNGNNQPID